MNYTLIWFKMDFHLYVFYFRQLKNLDLDETEKNKNKILDEAFSQKVIMAVAPVLWQQADIRENLIYIKRQEAIWTWSIEVKKHLSKNFHD